MASLPFGVMADRFRRTRTLGLAVLAWGVAMVWSATVSSFGKLLLARLALGVVTAAAGPIVASLVGDYFEGSERGRIYSYILTGELLGAGVGFAVTGDIAALSWRASFILLAIPAFVLGWVVLRLPEPDRGGRSPLIPEGAERPVATPPPGGAEDDTAPTPTDAQLIASSRGVQADPDKILDWDQLGSKSFNLIDAARAVLNIRTNVILIVASACGYFYLSGIETFGAEFVKEQFRVDQLLANLLLLVVGGGAILGGPHLRQLERSPAEAGLSQRSHRGRCGGGPGRHLPVRPGSDHPQRRDSTAVPDAGGPDAVRPEPAHRRGPPRHRPGLAVGAGRGHSHPAAVVGPIAGARVVRSGVGPRVRGRAQRPAVDLRRHVGVHGGERGDPAASHPHLPEGRGDRRRLHARRPGAGVRPAA